MGQFSRRVLQCSQEADHGRRTATWALEPLDIASPESVRWLIMIKWTMITSFEAHLVNSGMTNEPFPIGNVLNIFSYNFLDFDR